MNRCLRSTLLLVPLALLAACGPFVSAPTPTQSPPTAAPLPTQVVTAPTRPAPTQAAVVATAAPSPTAEPTPTPKPTAAPSPTATPAVDDLAGFAAALRPAFAGDVAANAALPRYDLRIWIDPAGGVLTGTERIVFPNRTRAPLDDVALRLYPNFPRDVLGRGGDVRMDVTGAAAAGLPVEVRYAAQRTAVLLPLAPPLAPGQWTTLSLTFTATIKPWGDGTWPLPSYYPMLAVHDDGGWRLDVTRFADQVYAESAFYAAAIDVPAQLSVAASGNTLATEERGGRVVHQARAGPMREFALTVGDFTVAKDQAGDVAVNVYTARGSTLEARAIARVSAAALADFDLRFGPYPYRELDIHLLVGDYDGGDEYPGLILLYSNGPVDMGTRYVAAHEVAHQWWYGVIGNDIYREAWLDEALAQYSGIIYAEDVEGPAVAAADWEREIVRRSRGALADGDWPIGLPIDEYPSFNVYYRTIYGKGAVFLRTLRERLGDEAFFSALQLYHRRHRYGVATTDDIRRAFEQASGQDLGALFRQWGAR